MADNPCEDVRRRVAKRLIAQFPDKMWAVRPMVDSELAQEFLLFTPQEILWSLPATTEYPPEPPPVKTVQLKLAFEMSVRSGPGTTYPTLGKLALGTVASFAADERPSANGYYWRRLADGYEGQAVAWIAEGTADGSKVYLVNP